MVGGVEGTICAKSHQYDKGSQMARHSHLVQASRGTSLPWFRVLKHIPRPTSIFPKPAAQRKAPQVITIVQPE